MTQTTWIEDLSRWRYEVWRRLRWRLAILINITAALILLAVIGTGIYTAASVALWGGALMVGAGLIVASAWGRALADSHRYYRWHYEDMEARRRERYEREFGHMPQVGGE